MALIQLANTLIVRETLGKGLKFPLTVDPRTRDFQRVEYEENVHECMFWMIATRIGERVMAEDIGTMTPEALFADIEGVMDIVPHQIIEAAARFEPRVTSVRVNANRTGLTDCRFDVSWFLRSTGTPGNLVYPYSAGGS